MKTFLARVSITISVFLNDKKNVYNKQLEVRKKRNRRVTMIGLIKRV